MDKQYCEVIEKYVDQTVSYTKALVLHNECTYDEGRIIVDDLIDLKEKIQKMSINDDADESTKET